VESSSAGTGTTVARSGRGRPALVAGSVEQRERERWNRGKGNRGERSMAGSCSRVKEEKQKGLRDLGINWVK